MKNKEYFEIDFVELDNIKSTETSNINEENCFYMNFKGIKRKKEIKMLRNLKRQLRKVTATQIVAASLATALVLGAIKTGESIHDAYKRTKEINKNKNKYLCLMEVKDEKHLELYDEENTRIELEIEKTKKMYVITTPDKTYETYASYLMNTNGEIQYCYLKRKNIDFKIHDYVEYKPEIKAEAEIDIVTPKEGCYIKKEKTMEENNEKQIKNGTYVIASTIDTTSPENDYYWKNVIYADIKHKKLYEGYVIDGYLMNKNFQDAWGIKLGATDVLNVRETPSLDGKITGKLKETQTVIQVPNIETETDDNIDWYYIAYVEEGKLKFGYCAGTQYIENRQPINYLKIIDDSYLYDEKYSKKKMDFTEYNNDKMIEKVVDITSTNVDKLKLRQEPGLESDIIYYLENNTYLYTYESNTKETIEKDGYNWLKVYLINGTEGYVADKYLKDYNYQKTTNMPYTYQFQNDQIKGYFGIDVNSTTNATKFEKLLTNECTYTDDYPRMEQTRKVDFAMIKIGATANGNGPFQIIEKTEAQKKNLNSLINICEKTKTNFGLYYYSQATTEEEANEEIKTILKLIEQLGLNSKTKKTLPLYIDVEKVGRDKGVSYLTRIYKNAQENGKTEQTKITNYLMEELRKQTNMEICLYTDGNTLESTINFDELSEMNKINCWIVESTQDHTNILDPEIMEYAKTRQTSLDRQIKINESNETINVDFDIMEEEFYKSRTK